MLGLIVGVLVWSWGRDDLGWSKQEIRKDGPHHNSRPPWKNVVPKGQPGPEVTSYSGVIVLERV